VAAGDEIEAQRDPQIQQALKAVENKPFRGMEARTLPSRPESTTP
jgi:hypothetical protein